MARAIPRSPRRRACACRAHRRGCHGALVLLPTCGHAPEHQSLWVRDGRATPLVFTADACDTQEHLDRGVLPHSVWDANAVAHSLTTLRDLRHTHGAALFYGHDPGQWQAIRYAPAPLL